jgi:hypothetical protein
MRNRCLRALSFAVVLSCFFLMVKQAFGQGPPPANTETESIRGIVVNGVTHEAIGRALVFSPDNRFATMTDSEGHFEFTFPASSASGAGSEPGQSNRPDTLMARKPGFLDDHNRASNLNAAGKELTISLTPEAMIVGRVALPSSDASDRIQVELYRRQVQDGRAHWVSAGLVTTRLNGEFRFADLPAASYKLLTHELLDRDPLTFDPRGQLYGYPPVYFPNAGDFASAETIQLSPGKTFQASISLVRQAYYQVKAPVANAQPGGEVRVTVSAQGRRGPGYALGYNQQEQTIVGMLPNGNYTVEASSFGVNSASGLSHMSVKASAVEGPRMTLMPNGSISVHVKEVFSSPEDTGSPGTVLNTGQPRANLRGPRRYLNVYLEPADDFGPEQGASLRNPTGLEDESLQIDNVYPGRYWVRINSSLGFASSITSGGIDLQRQPPVVSAGGSGSPIEVTMSDNGADVEGTVEGIAKPPVETETPSFRFGNRAMSYESSAHAYLVPLPDSSGEFRDVWVSQDGKFNLQQVPPGVYRALAFDHPQPELEYRDAEAMRAYESKGQVVRLVAGQKEQLRLQVISKAE